MSAKRESGDEKGKKKMDTIVRHKLFHWRAFEVDNPAVQWREEETIKW